MGKSGKGLKAALQSQQSRLKNKKKVAHAAQMAEQKYHRKGHPLNSPDSTTNGFCLSLNKNVKGKKMTPSNPSRRFTIPFKATDKVLLVGEGNFSFARALIVDPPPELSFFPPGNLTATAYDAESKCYEKYPESKDIVTLLRSKGVEIVFGVDGTRLEKHPTLRGRRWDRICWNFPHAGKGITDQDRNILSNQLLVLGFLRSASEMLQLGPIPNVAPSKKRKSGDEDEDDDGGEESSPELNGFSDQGNGSQAIAQPQVTGSLPPFSEELQGYSKISKKAASYWNRMRTT
ncbi:hypothetical protein NLJ89_g1231 [Agrocybe chaxingu]|uniref:25S rRNA (uridine-N(3))-methyltransferase BMT5-like domain-containing protein n=1 Tax=Agrocybe chaxingu TaxID=84603 RepID=A0A9W8N0I8_9AGAR|nr:hypothetical protein NLJ89_g1231 [Agrocybe chaxingu]